jgi:lipoprotein NlpI
LIYYNKILEKDTTDLMILNYKGIVLGKLGKYDEAIYCFNTILELDHNSIDAQKNKEYANYLKSRKYH